jgi:hypothetical protein
MPTIDRQSSGEVLATVSPHDLVMGFYEVISGASDAERVWHLFRKLFDPAARFYVSITTPDGVERTGHWTLEDFIEQHRDEYDTRGYWRSSLGYQEFVFGNVAHVLSVCQLRVGSPDAPPILRGIDSVQLVRLDGRWQITSMAFQAELPDLPIPTDFIAHAD